MFINRLKEIRDYEGDTQAQVAEFLHVDRATYAGWECGKDIIPLKRLYAIANHYKVSMDYILGLSNNNEKIKVSLKDRSNYNFVADNLKKFRKENNLTQKDIADVLNTTQSNIHKYETGKCLITTMYAIEFSKHYNYSIDKLFDRKK